MRRGEGGGAGGIGGGQPPLPLPAGLVSYTQLDVADPIAVAVNAAGPGLNWLRPIVKVGAILGLTSVIMVNIMGQVR